MLLTSGDSLGVTGLREWIALPELGLGSVRAKIDTGASTSTLHAADIVEFTREGQAWIRFTAFFGTLSQPHSKQQCEAALVARKTIKSSTGHVQERYVIRTLLVLGERSWSVEFTLTCRKTMRYRVLLGSKALIDGQLLVNPALAYVLNKPRIPLPPGSGAA
jgi:hypothetical protein